MAHTLIDGLSTKPTRLGTHDVCIDGPDGPVPIGALVVGAQHTAEQVELARAEVVNTRARKVEQQLRRAFQADADAVLEAARPLVRGADGAELPGEPPEETRRAVAKQTADKIAAMRAEVEAAREAAMTAAVLVKR